VSPDRRAGTPRLASSFQHARRRLRTRATEGAATVRESLGGRVSIGALAAGALAVTAWPLPTLLATVTVVVAWLARWRVLVVAGLAAAAILLALWWSLTLAAAALAAVVLLAWRAPAYGFLAALALFAFEGSLKASFTESELALVSSPVVTGAVILDLAFLAAFVGLVAWDRGQVLARFWRRLPLVGRAAAVLLAAWLVVSLVQIPVSGDLAQGLDGFRLTQGYVFAIAAGVLLVSVSTRDERILAALLGVLAVASGYAAARAIIGPSLVERTFALSRPGVSEYGEVFRTVGSFSGAVGLASFLVPAAAFAFVLTVASPRHRVLAVFVLACAVAGIIGTYSRAALAALAVGVVLAAVLALSSTFIARRHKLVALGALVVLIVGGTAATALASRGGAQVRERAHGFVDPLDDESFQTRLDTWRTSFEAARDEPLGSGLGVVGRASSLSGEPTVTTDNTYLKILREQGIVGAALFLLAMITACVAVVRGIRAGSGREAPLALAAIAGFVSFLVLAGSGEYVEQPGKILAWTLLGIAAGAALGDPIDAQSRPA
jgi:O-antigen ligase